MFIELCIIELPLSRVLVEFRLNPFQISIKFQPRISKLKICMETTAVQKRFLSFSPSTSTTKICKAYFSTIPWWPCKICYSGSQKMEANLIFSVNHLIHPLVPIILKPLLHQNFTQSVRKLKITAENFHANEN